MRTIKITIVLLITFTVLGFIRAGADFHIAKALPFCDGEAVSIYSWAGLITAGIFLWLLSGITPSFQFLDITGALGVVQENAYVRLACLGVLLIAITLIVKALKHHSR